MNGTDQAKRVRYARKHSYLSKVEDLLQNHQDAKNFLSPTNITGHGGTSNIAKTNMRIWSVQLKATLEVKSLDRLIKLGGTQTSDEAVPTICILENVSPECVERLGEAWGIDPQFFASYISNPTQNELWQKRQFRRPEVWPSEEHLLGIYENHDDQDWRLGIEAATSGNRRRAFARASSRWPVSCNTQISYCRVNKFLYLFLVDGSPPLPGWHDHRQGHGIVLRFPYARNNGGIAVPTGTGYGSTSLLEPAQILIQCFQENWQFRTMFMNYSTIRGDFGQDEFEMSERGVFPGCPFIYLMCNSRCEGVFRSLQTGIRTFSFTTLKKDAAPGNTIVLHDMREELSILRDTIEETMTYVQPAAHEYLNELKIYIIVADAEHQPLQQGLSSILARAEKLNTFLLETFQIFMNTVAIQDARSGLQVASSSLRLARLATVYLPLSLGVGVFGMNIAELNGDGQPVWVLVVTIVIVALTTVIYLEWYSVLEKIFSLRLLNLSRVGRIKSKP